MIKKIVNDFLGILYLIFIELIFTEHEIVLYSIFFRKD